jgi:hypothetical protein
LKFGSGLLVRPNALEESFPFTVPAESGPQGLLLVWQGEGHRWDQGCLPGPANDDGRFPCDQNDQLFEIITFDVNSRVVGQFIDHSAQDGDDDNYFYTFNFSNTVEGLNDLGLNHLNQGGPNDPNSVFYKGVVCSSKATATSTVTSTPTPTGTATATATGTATSTSTPTATVTSTPTATKVPTNLDPVDPPLQDWLKQLFAPFITN